MTVYVPPLSWFVGYFQVSAISIIIGIFFIFKRELSRLSGNVYSAILAISGLFFIFTIINGPSSTILLKTIFAPIINIISIAIVNIDRLQKYRKAYGRVLIAQGLAITLMLLFNDYFF